jgi:hypothetical protein
MRFAILLLLPEIWCSLTCVGGQWATTECGGNPIHRGAFWSFVLLMILSDISYSTANSVTDAITMDTLGAPHIITCSRRVNFVYLETPWMMQAKFHIKFFNS